MSINELKQKPDIYNDGTKSNSGNARFRIAVLGLTIAVVNCYAQATFCIAIVEMVLPADFVFKNETIESLVKVIKSSSVSSASLDLDLKDDQSCPVEYQYRDYYDSWRFPQQGSNSSEDHRVVSLSSSGVIDVSNRFNWDASSQGLLLGAFAIGTAPLQVIGGRMAEIYGAKWVLLAACVGTALTNLTVPLLAHFSFVLLLLNRVVMGIAQAGMEPGLMCLLAEWLTPAETSFFISMLLFAICIGFFLGSLCSSFLLTLGYGWPLTYYVAGGMNLLVAILWQVYASSRPRDSKVVSAQEVRYVEEAQQVSKATHHQAQRPEKLNEWQQNISISIITNPAKSQTVLVGREETVIASQAPWMNILRTPSVWAFIICKISIRWCADVLSTELPTYLANVLHLSIKLNGILNSVSSALFAIFSFITGYLVNKLVMDDEQSVGGLSKTTVRKVMQSCASFGAAITVFLMTRYDCNILFSMSMLLILSCCLVMGTGGELQIPYDMTPKYPGTLHGMACTMSVSGWLAPPLIGLILGDQPSSRHRWSIVWYSTAVINLLGGLVFVLFADASPRNFDLNRKVGRPKTSQPTDNNQKHCEQSSSSNTELHLTGYHNLACKSSPESIKHRSEQTSNYKSSTKLATSERLDNWSYFDRETIKIRQLEESFIKPNYLNNFDSVALHNLVIPYQMKKCDEHEQTSNCWIGKRICKRLSNLLLDRRKTSNNYSMPARVDSPLVDCDNLGGQIADVDNNSTRRLNLAKSSNKHQQQQQLSTLANAEFETQNGTITHL